MSIWATAPHPSLIWPHMMSSIQPYLTSTTWWDRRPSSRSWHICGMAKTTRPSSSSQFRSFFLLYRLMTADRCKCGIKCTVTNSNYSPNLLNRCDSQVIFITCGYLSYAVLTLNLCWLADIKTYTAWHLRSINPSEMAHNKTRTVFLANHLFCHLCDVLIYGLKLGPL